MNNYMRLINDYLVNLKGTKFEFEMYSSIISDLVYCFHNICGVYEEFIIDRSKIFENLTN